MPKQKEITFETPIRDCEPLYSPEDRKAVNDFFIEYNGQVIEWCLRSPGEIRRLRANRYYRGGILPVFVPSIFQHEYEAHNYFTEKYLTQVDVVDLREDSFEKVLFDIGKKQSKSRNTIKRTKIEENIFEIRWVKSTSVLSKRDFADFINKVILEGQTEHGLEFEPIEKFNEHK